MTRSGPLSRDTDTRCRRVPVRVKVTSTTPAYRVTSPPFYPAPTSNPALRRAGATEAPARTSSTRPYAFASSAVI